MAELKFTKTHEWTKIEGDIALVGITDYAQHELGDIVFVELPKVGDKVNQSSRLVTIESTKAAVEVYAPLTGEIIEVNAELMSNPQWINESPHDAGWMVRIKIDNEKEIDDLLDESSYKEFVEKKSR